MFNYSRTPAKRTLFQPGPARFGKNLSIPATGSSPQMVGAIAVDHKEGGIVAIACGPSPVLLAAHCLHSVIRRLLFHLWRQIGKCLATQGAPVMIVNAYAAVTARRPAGQSGDNGHHACIRRPPRHRPADRNVPHVPGERRHGKAQGGPGALPDHFSKRHLMSLELQWYG
jgi:hypothetical protein